MNTLSESGKKSILLRIAEKLLQAQQELDQLAVQLALGKAEAKDKFEEIKTGFRSRVNELKQSISQDKGSNDLAALVLKIEELDILLSSGKVETRGSFEIQKEKILKAITEIESRIKNKFTTISALNNFTGEFEKFKLKLEILRLKFVVKKFEVKEGFRTGMKTTRKEIAGIVERVEDRFNKSKITVNDFTEEIYHSYQRLRKVIDQL